MNMYYIVCDIIARIKGNLVIILYIRKLRPRKVKSFIFQSNDSILLLLAAFFPAVY